MVKCIGIFGRLFGHSFVHAYSATHKIDQDMLVIERHRQYAVCTRCGHVVRAA